MTKHPLAATLTHVTVPAPCMRALLPPGAPRPAAVGLQIFLDGVRYGGRFPTLVGLCNQATRGVARCTELEGCAVVGFRVAAPGALDILFESEAGGGGGGGGGGEEGAGAMQE